MSDLNEKLAEMPKAPIEHSIYPLSKVLEKQWWDEATKAQCKLLAEQGWRKVPSEEEILNKLCESTKGSKAQKLVRDICRGDAEMLHRWLLEGV